MIAAVVECKQPTVAVDTSVASVTPSRTDLDTFHKAYGFQLCSDFDEEQKYQVLELSYRYKTVFARDLSEIKECKGEPLQLTLHTDRKMFKRQFRLSERDKIEMAKQIKAMEEANIIERSSSTYYNSPTYLVLKKNGQKRMVVDLRGISSLIIPKLVQLPQIEEMLDTICAKKIAVVELS